MKNLLLIITGLISASSVAGQDYFPIVAENSVWNVVQFVESGPMPWDTIYWTETYKISGDTNFNNLAYKKVYMSEEEFPSNWNYHGAIREGDEKVWYLPHYTGEEGLLYDFTLETGDTVNFLYEPMIVDTVTYAEINGELRKHIHFAYFGEIWMEGIGSTRGILQSGTAGFDGGGYWFLCKKENGELVYMNPNYSSCYLITTGVDERNEHAIEVYPNPVKDNLIVKITEPVKIKQITITDLLGQHIEAFKWISTGLDLSGLAPGIYFLSVVTENGEIIKKIIKE